MALSPSDGKLLWKIDATAPLTGRAAVADGIVYFGSADGRIYGVDAATGQEVWGSGIVAQGAVEAQPTVIGGRVSSAQVTAAFTRWRPTKAVSTGITPLRMPSTPGHW